MKEEHRDEKSIKPCEICGKMIAKLNFKKHELIHSGEKKFACDRCPMRFLFADNLKVILTISEFTSYT